ncbi:thioesterase family protein [Jeotgalibacillus sp. R-1-5s-1]|uniref:acyl-CoA thioesterase n=1 Tax=Jeotgalibacillus sp. R-1-5s-1 TaxID=2555897 RepID=UPI00106BCD75|nr:thioesterase family protein [Jeotgalibacillus sp. R-1-5s-1]TFD92451.1 acyl-CoA thioesterase [Jeotgalibacillus sp. R-1-5s-1]
MKISYIEDFEAWQKEFTFSYPVKVRFSETDLFGHLNNTVPFVYFEQARIEYLKSLGFMQDWVNPSNETIPVVANLQCDYLKQVFFDEDINVFVKANSVGNSSVDIHYLGLNRKNVPVFVGRGTMVQISKTTGKGVAWTDSEKEQLRPTEQLQK